MLSSFQLKKEPKKATEQPETLGLLAEAIKSVLNDNTHRVYIEDKSYRVNFKLPLGIDLLALQQALQGQKLQFCEKKIVDENIVVHTYKLLPNLDKIIEVWYQPIARPRI